MRHWIISTALGIFALQGCGQDGVQAPQSAQKKEVAQPAPSPSLSRERILEQPDENNSLTVENESLGFVPTHAVVLSGTFDIGEPVPVVIVVQSDAPDICAHYQAGTQPAGKNMFAIAFIQQDQKPVEADKVYSAEPDTTYFAYAQLRRFDRACHISPSADDGQGRQGQAILREWTPGHRAVGDYTFTLGEEGTAILGHFDAVYCDAPKLFEDVDSLYQPQANSETCVTRAENDVSQIAESPLS